MPAGDRDHRARTLDFLPPPPGRLHSLGPARRHEPRGELGPRREDEESMARLRVGDRQSRSAVTTWGRNEEALTPEGEDVEVDLPRSPTVARLTSEGLLGRLADVEEQLGSLDWSAPEANQEARHGVEEIGLVRHADRPGPVEAGDGRESQHRRPSESHDGARECGRGIADVGAESDVRWPRQDAMGDPCLLSHPSRPVGVTP